MGFDACGISCATHLETESEHVEQWLEGGREGEMGYLTRNKEKRYDPRLLVEGTKSIVTVLYNYFPKQQIGDHGRYKIAKYAYGADYHDVLKRKMRQLLERIEAQTGKLEGCRVFVDSAPVLDRAWAVRCGLGFIGKNTTLIHPKKGSFFFIGHLFLPLELEETGTPLANRCGRCTRCIDACPTGALEAPFQIDARKCISYLTIEYKGSLEGHNPERFNGWMYGCDTCQDVCPLNVDAQVTYIRPFLDRANPNVTVDDLATADDRAYLYRGRAVIERNIKALEEDPDDPGGGSGSDDTDLF